MKLTVVGSGDAFGSGGRLQTCYHVADGDTSFLIDCGASSLIGFHKLGLDPASVPTIFISHLHGDHFSGLVWWLLHAQHVSHRRAPLTVVGPQGIEDRLRAAVAALFPGALPGNLKFDLVFIEIEEGREMEAGGVRVRAFEVSHPCGAPPYAFRFEVKDRVIGFSGDTEWVDALIDVARDADLYISECFGYEKPARYHMNWAVVRDKLPLLSARRIMLTHMGPAMLEHLDTIEDARLTLAEDGLVVEI